MPCIHAAFPVLVWLVLWRLWPRWGWVSVIYPIAMSVAVIYAGEHYLVDVLAGWLYAAVAFGLTWWTFGRAVATRERGREPAVPVATRPLGPNAVRQPVFVTTNTGLPRSGEPR